MDSQARLLKGSFSYIPGSTLINLGKTISEDMFFMPSVFVSRAFGFIVGSICGNYIFENLRLKSSKKKHLVFFSSMLVLSLMSLAISLVTTLLRLILAFCVAGTCMATLVAGVNAVCLFSGEDMGIPFYETLSTFYALGAVFAPVLSRNHHPEKVIPGVEHTIHTDTVSYVYKIFAGGAFIVSLLWLLQYCFTAFNSPTVSEPDRKSEDVSLLKYLAIFNTSMLCFLGLTICFSYVLLLPTYSIFVYDMSQNESCDFMTLFLGLAAFGRLLSKILSNRIEPPKALLIGISLVLFAVMIMYLKWEFFGSNFWSANSFIGFGSGPMIPSLFVWFSHELKITPRIVLILHLVGALSELVVPSVLNLYILDDDGKRTSRNGFLLTIALAYVIFLLFQYILFESLHKNTTLGTAAPATFQEVALSDMSAAERTWSSERFTFDASLEAAEDDREKENVVNHEDVIQRLSEVKSRIRIQNRDIRLALHNLAYSGSQLKVS